MKKRILSLVLAIVMCLSIIPFAAMTVFADDGIEVWVNGTMLAVDGYSHPLGNGIGSAAAGLSDNTLTVTLSRAQIGSPKYFSDVSRTCGIYIKVTKGQNIEILLDGATECYGDLVVARYGGSSDNTTGSISFINSTNQDGALTVHGTTELYYAREVFFDNVKLNFQADQSMDTAALYVFSNLTVGKLLKGGGTIDAPEVTVGYDGTDRPLGMFALSLTANQGMMQIYGGKVGCYLQPNDVNVTAFTGNNGYTEFYGAAAALLIEDYDPSYYAGKPYEFAPGYGEKNGNEVCRSASIPDPYSGIDTLSYYTWDSTAHTFTGITDNVSVYTYDWHNADFGGKAAKALCFGELTGTWVTFDTGAFGEINDEQFVYKQCMPGEPIGVLPVPSNITFRTGTFNNMYFEGWQPVGDYGNIIDESYIVPNSGVSLEAVWAEGQSGMSFKDVKTSDWFYDAVRYCYGQGVISGTDSKTFSPYTNCSRAMIVSILYRLDGSFKSSIGSNPFSDVAKGKWYYDAVLWAAENGIVSGDGKGHFLPDANVTREQLAQIMRTYATYCGRYCTNACVMLAGYPDSGKVSGWAADSVSWAVGMGFISGKPQNGMNYLDPQGKATRAEFASILLRYIKAFDGNATYFVGDYLWVEVPAYWVGNVVCRYDKDSRTLSFYAKKAYQAQDGTAGRLFWMGVCSDYDNYLEDPNFHTACGCLLYGGDICYQVCLFEPTDIQCPYYKTNAIGAQYFDMLKDYDELAAGYGSSFLLDSFYFTFSQGVG